MNPYTQPPHATTTVTERPLYKRKRVWAVGVAVFAFGVMGGTQSAQDEVRAAQAVAAKPAPTVTVTATATATETAEPEPAPTVTKTKRVETPGPRVTVTVAPATGGSGGPGSGGGGGGSADRTDTCSIRSNAGNCYQAGQFCRNADHGAVTTTASGARIKCAASGNSWRWTYA